MDSNIIIHLNYEYILSVNLIVYFIIKTLLPLASKTIKIISTFMIGLILSIIFYLLKIISIAEIIPSFCVAVILYDYIIKYILKSFKNLSYRK